MLNNIKVWWKFEGRYYHRDFIQGIKNLWVWLPIVWKDRDWDYYHLLQIMRFKISKQSNFIKLRGNHVNSLHVANRMRLVSELIRRTEEDFYSVEYLEYCERAYKFTPTDSGNYELESIDVVDNLDDYFEKYPRQYNRAVLGELNVYGDDLAEKSRHTIAMEISAENQRRCDALIFKLISVHLKEWWD